MLQAEGGNKTRAAQRLGLDRKTLYRKLEEYGRAPGESSPPPEVDERSEREVTVEPPRNESTMPIPRSVQAATTSTTDGNRSPHRALHPVAPSHSSPRRAIAYFTSVETRVKAPAARRR